MCCIHTPYMQLYNTHDLEIFDQKIQNILNKIKDITQNKFEPTKKEKDSADALIFDYISKNKRKIYGGYAQNKLIVTKNPKDGFYDERNETDIDFYSPDPINDVINISNMLHKEGFKDVSGKEAMHEETYSVFVNTFNSCDISYVPRNIFHRMPFIAVDGINYVHPSFMMIDLYRMLTDPYFSSDFRWKKTFPRIVALQKNFPFRSVKSKLPKLEKQTAKVDVLETVLSYIVNNDTTITYNNYAYNMFLKESKIKKSNKSHNYNVVDVPYYEFISTNYKDNVLALVELLKKNHPDSKVTIDEHYPFWMLLDYSAYVKVDDMIVAHISGDNKRCVPYKSIKLSGDKDFIHIASFDFTLLMLMITGFRKRVLKDSRERYYNNMTSHLIELRNYYLKKNNKTFLDDTLFQEFTFICKGNAVNPLRETRLKRQERYKARKMVIYKYDPSKEHASPSTYMFPNSSGNIINNPKNLRLR